MRRKQATAGVAVGLAVMLLAGCKPDQGTQVDSTKVKKVDTQTAVQKINDDPHMPPQAKQAAIAAMMAHQTSGH